MAPKRMAVISSFMLSVPPSALAKPLRGRSWDSTSFIAFSAGFGLAPR